MFAGLLVGVALAWWAISVDTRSRERPLDPPPTVHDRPADLVVSEQARVSESVAVGDSPVVREILNPTPDPAIGAGEAQARPTANSKRTPASVAALKQAARWSGVELRIPEALTPRQQSELDLAFGDFVGKRNELEQTRGPLVVDLADALEAAGQYREWPSLGSISDPAERSRVSRELRAAKAQAGDNFVIRSNPKYTRLIAIPPGYDPGLDELTSKFRENAVVFVSRARTALVR